MTETATLPLAVKPWVHETFEASFESVKRQAAANFDRHVLEEVGPQEWWCHRPGTGSYSFRVLIRPGTVIIWGDGINAIFRGGEARGTADYTLEWLQECTASDRYPSTYLCEKLRPQREEFYPGDAIEYARERIEEGDGRRLEGWKHLFRTARDWYRDGYLDQRTWSQLALDTLGDFEVCSVATKPASDTLWAIEGLRWFCRAQKRQEAAAGGAPCP